MSIRGIEERHERSARQMARDTRPLGERFIDFLSNPLHLLLILGANVITAVMFNSFADLLLLVNLGLFIFIKSRKLTLPFKMPLISKVPDYNDTIPGTTTPRKAAGIAYFGNEKVTNKELWFSNDDLRTHCLIFGSTGSGKTENLVAIAYNSLTQGSGFIYVDGKGDNSLYAKVFSMVRSMGRDDDLLLINFMTGARDVIGPQKSRLSNTMNPFALGSSSMLAQLVVSLMDSGSGGSDGDMWKGRAISFVEALMKVLVAMRDEGHILLDANIIRNYFILEKLEEIVIDKTFPIDNGASIPLNNLDDVILEPIKNYVINLPGYNPGKKGNQASEVREQHGFITMQLGRVFGSLADTYGHIIRTNLAEVDLKDVVLNRRILVVLLPALEKSPEELSNLGKVIIASLKSMMAAGLGDEVEGTYRDVIQRKPTNSPTPYVCIMDEYGYYAVKGFAVVPAQARSLGFSAIFAGQDLPAFQKASKEEAASIGANTNIKICMKLEDPTDTWDFFNKTAGEAYVTNVREFQVNAGSMTNNYMDNRSASVDRRQRIELLDLKDQREGDMHIFYRSKIIRARTFYANPKPAKKMQVNQSLCVERPTDEELTNLDKLFRRFSQVFKDTNFVMEGPKEEDEIELFAEFINNKPREGKPSETDSFERSIAAVVAILENETKKQKDLEGLIEQEKSQEFTGEVTAFNAVFLPEVAKPLLTEEELNYFSSPILIRSRTREAILHIERIIGDRTETEATKFADSLIDEIIKITKYPLKLHFAPDPKDIAETIEDLIADFSGEQYQSGGGSSKGDIAENRMSDEMWKQFNEDLDDDLNDELDRDLDDELDDDLDDDKDK